jgi:hypothetical protein
MTCQFPFTSRIGQAKFKIGEWVEIKAKVTGQITGKPAKRESNLIFNLVPYYLS